MSSRWLPCALTVTLLACDPPPPPPPPAPTCDVDPAGAPPRPGWSEQPTRPAPPTFPGGGPSSIGSVVSCDPSNLGQYPVPENGYTDVKAADLQNISTNFHVVQSIRLLASVAQKAVSRLDEFKTDANEPLGPGRCLCDGAVSAPSSFTLSACSFTNKTRDECELECDPSQNLTLDPACGSGVGIWLPNDVFKDEEARNKFALDLVGLLDDLQDFTNSDVYDAIQTALTVAGSGLENTTEILTEMSCWVDVFTEGYHLGGYSDQRPDLHLCVGYYGHGAYARMAENDRFDIGGRYTSFNLSESHRAQMRTGGFGVTAFGETLSILPGVEFNVQIDGHRMFDACSPLGIDALGDGSNPLCPAATMPAVYIGSGTPPPGTVPLSQIDIFSLVEEADVVDLDSDGDQVLSPGEFIVATYSPFSYGAYDWPRPTVTEEWEGESAAVIGAGVNINPELETIEKNLGTAVIAPGVAITPILKLDAGAEWMHEGYLFRERFFEAMNTNLAPVDQLGFEVFDRDQHSFQAPDVTADDGTRVHVNPSVTLLLTLGIPLGSKVQLGVLASIGLGVDLVPGGYGGIVDLSRGMVEALNASNPPQELPCEPILEETPRQVCSDTQFDSFEPGSDPDSTYICDAAESENSCCLAVTRRAQNGGAGTVTAHTCIDDWTGIAEEDCGCKQNETLEPCVERLSEYLDDTAASQLGFVLGNGSLMSITGTWSADKTCLECQKDGTCPFEGEPRKDEREECRNFGYCVTGETVTYDVAEDDCAGEWTHYACITVVDVVASGWEGPGCHPLNTGFPSACGCGADADCAAGETCVDGHCSQSGTPVSCMCDPAAPGTCPAGRACVDGACVLTCGSCGNYTECNAGLCEPESGVPYAEQVAYDATSSSAPQHSIESYGMTDLELLAYLSTAIELGLKIKLFGKLKEFSIWDWHHAWDLGSTQKSKYQPGLEATYEDQCDDDNGVVTNHQPGSATGALCDGGDNFVCRYPSGPAYDQPNELLTLCKDELPEHATNPQAPTADDFGDAMTDLVDFGVGVGENAWEQSQLCVGGEPLVSWLQDPDVSTCSYTGSVTGAPASFPCDQATDYLLEVYGCLNDDSPLGGLVASYIAGDPSLSGHAPPYVVAPTYASSLTSTQVLDLDAIVVDPTALVPVLDTDLQLALSAVEEWQVHNWLAWVQVCFDQHAAADSVCECTTGADCDLGQSCSGSGACLEPSGYVAECQVITIGGPEVELCCGDGVVQAGEQCDDGGTDGGDACSAHCELEEKAACCTPDGCIELGGALAPERCAGEGGSLFWGETCAELDQCGHEIPVGCIGEDGQCHYPASAEACAGTVVPDCQ